jgi:oligopeptide/dipeptide ABC transporter ATP-binding protein
MIELSPVLAVEGLTTVYGDAEQIRAVDRLTFSVQPAQIFGLVGESGSGKSTAVRSIIRLLPGRRARIIGGAVKLDGIDLLRLSESAMRRIRGSKIGFVSQDPMTSLNPVLSVGYQIGEGLRYHGTPRSAIRERVLQTLRLVGMPEPMRRIRAYPHELSGGLRQRVAIAIALAGSPQVLLADEPTTALDVTIQDQILKLLVALRDQLGMSVVLVTHDLGVVAQTCSQVAVMYAGRLMEIGPVGSVFQAPAHPYTRGLLGSLPKMGSHGRLRGITGSPPDLATLPSGCAFRTRCPYAVKACAEAVPDLMPHGPDRLTACIRHDEISDALGS